MSLHLGNLSPRIRKDELERIFWRFGRCTVQLKDGYGFAVFDLRGDAEKALRELKGRKICGQFIHLSWSNKQPKPLKSFSRAAESSDQRYGRISGRGDNHVRQKFSGSRRDYTMSKKQPDDDGLRHKAVVGHDHRRSFDHNDVENDHHHHKEFLEEDGFVEPGHVDNGSWGDQVDIPQDVNGDDEKIVFDRYVPDCVDERDEFENRSLGNTESSPSAETLIDKSNRVHHAHSVRGHYTCFECGAAGHKMRDCPLKDAFHGKSLYRFGHRHGDEGDSRSRERDEDGGPESRPRERLEPSRRNSRSARRDEANEKESLLEREETNGRSSADRNASNRTKTKDYCRKRQREREDQIVEMLDNKKSKKLASSHLPSGDTSPHFGTHSKSRRPTPDSILRSRSGSPVMHSLSAKSRSKTRSNHSRFRSVKSKSKSGSSLPSSSFSISHGRSLPSSANKEEIDLNDSVLDPQFKEDLNEVWPESDPGIGDEKISADNKAEAGVSCYIEDSGCQLEEDLIERHQLEVDLKDENETSVNSRNRSLNGSLGWSPHSQEKSCAEIWQLEPESRNNSLKVGDVPRRGQDLSSASEVRDDRKMNQSNIVNSSSAIIPLVSCEIRFPCRSSAEQGDRDTAAGQPSAEKLREVKELENGNCLEMVQSLEPACESVPKAPFKVRVGSHMSISAEELCRVLKHYSLKHSEEDEQKLGAEDYFGAARLWPWALIYYRRLKKGPVSEDNYSRRVA